MKSFKLNYAQINALKAIRLAEKNGIKKGVIVLPTGTGKTILSAMITKESKGKTLFLVHRQEIAQQARTAYEKIIGKNDYSFYNSFEKRIGKYTFANVQTITKNLEVISPTEFEYIIVDEVHHYEAFTYRKVINYFKPKLLIGLTATPNRMDNKDIFKLCGQPIYELSTKEAIEKKLLCGINYEFVDNDIDFSKIKWNGNGYDEKDLNKKICIPKYDKAILDEFKKSAITKKTIVFCSTVKHANRLNELFNKEGISSTLITNFTKESDRRIHFNDYLNGKYQVIFVRDIFNEGVDIPNAECIIFLRWTKSDVIFIQQLGRGLRKSMGKKEVLVLDFVGNAKRSNIGLNILSGLFGKDLIEIVKEAARKDKREIVVFNYGNRIRLNKSKIDFFKENLAVSQRDLINEFHEVKSKLGRVPFLYEWNNLSKYKSHYFFSLYQNYNLFLKAIGEEQTKNIFTEEELKKKYFNLKSKLNRVPIEKEYGLRGFIQRRYGSYYNFVSKMENKKISPVVLRSEQKLKWLEEKWIAFTLSKDFKLNKIMFLKFIGKKDWSGSWPISYRDLIKTTRHRDITSPVSKEELIQRYKEYRKKVGYVPSVHELRREAHVNDTLIRKNFGSYKKFYQLMEEYDKLRLLSIMNPNIGKKKNRYLLHWDKEEIDKIYEEAKQKLGHVPSGEELKGLYRISGKVFKRFYGSYNEFLLSKGERPIMPGNKVKGIVFENDKKDIIQKFNEFKSKIGRVPSTYDFQKMGDKQIQWRIVKSYGSYEKFLSLMNEKRSFHVSNLKTFYDYPKEETQMEVFSTGAGTFNFPKSTGKKHEFTHKNLIRSKILSYVKNGDTLLLLESPALFAIKELIELKVKPSKVIIPNNQEYQELVTALLGLKLPFKVEVHRCSSTQYLRLTSFVFDWVWLDYFGSFSQYSKDIDLVYSKKLIRENGYLFGTYRILDLKKKNETHYFSEVVNYCLNWSYRTNQLFQLVSDVSIRYKSTMYNVGIQFGNTNGIDGVGSPVLLRDLNPIKLIKSEGGV